MKSFFLSIFIFILSGCFDIPVFVITADDGSGSVNPNPITSQFYDTTLAYVINKGDTIRFTSSMPPLSYCSINNSSWQFFGYHGETSFTGTSYNPAETLKYSLRVSQDSLLFTREFKWEEYSFWNDEYLEIQKSKNWSTLLLIPNDSTVSLDSSYNYLPVPFPVALEDTIPFSVEMSNGSWSFRMFQEGSEMILNSATGPLYISNGERSGSFNDYLLERTNEIAVDPLPLIREFIAKEAVVEEYYNSYDFDSTADTQGYLLIE